MRTIQTTVYQFSELSDSARKTAISRYRDSYEDFSYYAETVIEDAATIADIIGIDLRNTLTTRNDGTTLYAPTVFYSGFCSQGDGACFEGSYSYKKGALKALIDYAPLDTELHRIAKQLQDLQRVNFYKLTAKMKHRGYYNHSGCMHVEINSSRTVSNDTEDELTHLMCDFADWIYSQLTIEYEYQNSDDQITENFEANEYEFNENGVIV